ncbi:hypothetical protein IC229_27645 [Spirosoma sp. BT702]|uniref:Uncharacterized protein n=1 Tax=Spirosoma profusum TaxID=2771354 RepID=A0A926Y1N7_9BACT|nr:hypothetical protein [Spirosoma profusum]MBD2704446.1 hypothetical protein [Spirosoma profusum]
MSGKKAKALRKEMSHLKFPLVEIAPGFEVNHRRRILGLARSTGALLDDAADQYATKNGMIGKAKVKDNLRRLTQK